MSEQSAESVATDTAELAKRVDWAAWWADRYTRLPASGFDCCRRCGAIVFETQNHDRWHDYVDDHLARIDGSVS